jgi:hypothetical protein
MIRRRHTQPAFAFGVLEAPSSFPPLEGLRSAHRAAFEIQIRSGEGEVLARSHASRHRESKQDLICVPRNRSDELLGLLDIEHDERRRGWRGRSISSAGFDRISFQRTACRNAENRTACVYRIVRADRFRLSNSL